MELVLTRVSGGYGEKPIACDISFAVNAGEWLSIVGANGSGKSTLLRLMSRLLEPTSGMVQLEGESIHERSPQWVARRIALMPQQQVIPAGISVEQFVGLGRAPYQEWWRWSLSIRDRDIVRAAMHDAQVEQFSQHAVERLSGGERQRVLLALALAQTPTVLLLDEPTTYLDLHFQLELLDFIKRLQHQRQLAVVTVLHDINLAARYSDRLAMLRSGSLYAIGTPCEVITPVHLAAVFNIEAEVLSTARGLQIFPIAACSSDAASTQPQVPLVNSAS